MTARASLVATAFAFACALTGCTSTTYWRAPDGSRTLACTDSTLIIPIPLGFAWQRYEGCNRADLRSLGWQPMEAPQ